MLLIECKITEACKTGDDFAEVTQVDTHVVELSNGQKERRPIWGSVRMRGLPLGETPGSLPAPVDLRVGDVVRVVDNFPARLLWDVQRGGKAIWSNDALKAEYDAKASDKDKVRKAREVLE